MVTKSILLTGTLEESKIYMLEMSCLYYSTLSSQTTFHTFY